MMLRSGALLAALLVLAGCGGEKTETVKGADGSQTRITTTADGEAAVIAGRAVDGSTSTMVAGSGTRWPETAPDYAPAYPGAQMQMAMSADSSDGGASFLSFTTPDPPAKVVDFYKERANAAGLSEQSNMDTEGARMFAAKSPDGRALSVQATVEGGTTTGVVSFGKQPG